MGIPVVVVKAAVMWCLEARAWARAATCCCPASTAANGFKLDGENNGDQSGVSVSAAGDINGDGYDDLLIGAYEYPGGSRQGRSYVVFGGPGVGQSGGLLLSSLNGANGFKLDGENNGDWSGYSVSAAGDINGDSVEDVLIGAFAYPNGAYKGRTYVVFGDIPPVLVNNSLVLFGGEIISLGASNLAAYDRNHNNSTLMFIPTNITHGQFELINNSGLMLNNFTQQQIWDNQIQFVHDGSSEAPAYNITVRSDGIAWTGPISANVILLVHNQLTIGEGQSITFTSENLLATHNGITESNLTFQVANIQNGGFILLAEQQRIIDRRCFI